MVAARLFGHRGGGRKGRADLDQKLATSGVTGSASCTTTATTGSPAGTYPITCKVGTLSAANYSFAKFVKGTLTVT